MKALFKIQKAGVIAKPLLDYLLSSKDGCDPKLRNAHVIVSDDLKDLDLQTAEGKKEASMIIEAHSRENCTRKYTTKKGKRVSARHRDHFTISAPNGCCHKAFKLALSIALKELTKDLNIKSFVCVIHRDTDQPHCHIVCESFAPTIGKGKRRHICKTKLEMLNENNWTKMFDAPTVTKPSKCSARSKSVKLVSLKNWSKEKIELAAVLHYHKIHDVKELVRINSPAITKDLYNTRGQLKKTASIKKNDTTLRLNTYFKNLYALQDNEIFKKKLELLKERKKKLFCGGCNKKRSNCECTNLRGI